MIRCQFMSTDAKTRDIQEWRSYILLGINPIYIVTNVRGNYTGFLNRSRGTEIRSILSLISGKENTRSGENEKTGNENKKSDSKQGTEK